MAYDFNSLTKQADEANNRDGFYTDFEDVDPNVLHQISELTDWMRTKAKGSDVREVIAQLFERTWLEESKKGNANMEVAKARGRFPVLNDRLNNADRERAENARKLEQKANKDEVTNVMTPKGTLAYASLPTSGNQVGWYYYCPDGDGVHGAGNYVWNGTSWYFGGTGDEGYNLLKEDLVYRTSSVIAQLNMTDGAVLKKDGGKENNESWATSNMIDVNGCKYIRVKGLFNNLQEQSGYAHIVFYAYDELSSDNKVSSVILAVDEMKTVDVTLEIPSEANYFAICNSVANKGSVSVEKYYKNLVISDLSNLIDLTSVIVGKDITVNGLTLHFNNNEVTFNGTTTTNTTFLVYSSNNQNLLKNGTEYIVDFKPLNGNKNVYLQMFNNMTSNALVNGQIANNQLVKIPENANDVFIRFIAFAGTYSNERYNFSIKRKVNCYSDVHINSASELYNFMKNPAPFTRLYLETGEYNLYSGLFENDIANNISISTDNFLHDVIIYGNNSKITLNIPAEVLNQKPEICNTYSCLNVKGNIEVNDTEFEAKNCRYVLHEESLDNPLWFHTKHSYNNCKFSYLGYDYPTVNANTVGCGFSKGQIVEFVNCEFVNETPTDYTFYVHGRDFNISRLAFISCIFNNRENAFSLGLSQYTGNGEKSNVLISNSYIGKINFLTQNNGLRNNQWFVKALNSYITQMNVDESTTLLYQPMFVNTISGLVN